ncbi:hypothetical protein GJW-30_1_01729 [Variibacter gotjawalensis]|uniref:Plasmid stabilization protein n=1 Tax=Variibacter gotjawalensis TaxID=1333996 RepID=A0A0S3PTQ9_9BRAD|nr:plasmid stabilization protein [Variibacter gotjawalensis]NIK49513.1 hypothetical protein [Variibacter gotjawalensis]RZS51365.1 hypothetical protein EV661_3844 [Variibacter gotjawalensis]BAT59198.1 hypothetical protein GJW-30_1_01729 [Variibacter gotjawalensis]
MPEPQLSVRSAKARDLAHRLAQRERRTIADIVERALERYEAAQTGQESPEAFYTRLYQETGEDGVDLQALIDENRKPNPGIEF